MAFVKASTLDELWVGDTRPYRSRQLAGTRPGFGDGSAGAWQRGAAWQPLRTCVEKLLVTYDWGEAFVALNLVVKPAVDELTTVWLARLAERRGDELLAALLSSLAEDRRWHRAWSAALARMASQDVEDNRAVIEGWIDRWHPPVRAAIEALAVVFDGEATGTVEAILDGASSILDDAGLAEGGTT